MYHLVHQYTHLHVVASGVCFSAQLWIQQVFGCGFGALLGSECISRRSAGCLVAGQSGNPKAQISVWVNCCAPSALGG